VIEAKLLRPRIKVKTENTSVCLSQSL